MHMWTHTQHDYKCKQQHLLLTPGWETSNMYYCISRVILLQWPWQAILSVLCFLLLSILPLWQSVQHLVKSFPLSSPRSPSLSPVLPHTSTPHPFSLPVWVTPAWVSLWSIKQGHLLDNCTLINNLHLNSEFYWLWDFSMLSMASEDLMMIWDLVRVQFTNSAILLCTPNMWTRMRRPWWDAKMTLVDRFLRGEKKAHDCWIKRTQAEAEEKCLVGWL